MATSKLSKIFAYLKKLAASSPNNNAQYYEHRFDDDIKFMQDSYTPPKHDNFGVNPASGLPMMEGGGFDIGGNFYGDNDY